MSGPSELTPDVVESSGTPLGSSLFSDHTELSTEQVEIGIFQRDGPTIFALLTVAVSTRICSIQCKTHQQGLLIAQEEVISVYGDQQGNPIGEGIDLPAGDYCLGLSFNSKEEADSVLSIGFEAQSYPVSNFYLSQIMFGMYRSMGFEPSHVLKYPNRSIAVATPFYRKTRADIEKARDQIKGELKLIHEQPPAWIHQPPSWSQQQPSWFQQSPQWMNQTPQWFQQQPSWVNQTPQWMQQPPAWFDKVTETLSELSRSVQTLQTSFDELKSSLLSSSPGDKIAELSALVTQNSNASSEKVMEKMDLLCQKLETPVKMDVPEKEEIPVKEEIPREEDKKEVTNPLAELQVKLDEIKLTLDKLTQDERPSNLQSSVDKSSSTLEHVNGIVERVTELVERSNGMLDRLVQTQNTPLNLEELHSNIKKSLQDLLSTHLQTSLQPPQSSPNKESLDNLATKLQKSLEDLNQVVLQRLTQMQSEFSRLVEQRGETKGHQNMETLISLKTQLEKFAEDQRKVVSVDDLERLILERKTFYEQLQRAEDYIDSVQDRRSPPDRRTSRATGGRRPNGH